MRWHPVQTATSPYLTSRSREAAAGHLHLDGAVAARTVHELVVRVVVLALAVPAQIHLALERLFAETARERLVSGVLSHVRDQVRALAERLLADDTLVRLFACERGRNNHKIN